MKGGGVEMLMDNTFPIIPHKDLYISIVNSFMRLVVSYQAGFLCYALAQLYNHHHLHLIDLAIPDSVEVPY